MGHAWKRVWTGPKGSAATAGSPLSEGLRVRRSICADALSNPTKVRHDYNFNRRPQHQGVVQALKSSLRAGRDRHRVFPDRRRIANRDDRGPSVNRSRAPFRQRHSGVASADSRGSPSRVYPGRVSTTDPELSRGLDNVRPVRSHCNPHRGPVIRNHPTCFLLRATWYVSMAA